MKLRDGGLFRVPPYNVGDGRDSPLDETSYFLLENTEQQVLPIEFIPCITKGKAELHTLFLLILSDYSFLCRLLKRSEYDTYTAYLSTNGDSPALRFEIAKMAVIAIHTPENTILHSLDEMDTLNIKAFTIAAICDHIIKISSFSDPDYLQDLQDLNTQNIAQGYYSYILNWHLKSNINNITNKELSKFCTKVSK